MENILISLSRCQGRNGNQGQRGPRTHTLHPKHPPTHPHTRTHFYPRSLFFFLVFFNTLFFRAGVGGVLESIHLHSASSGGSGARPGLNRRRAAEGGERCQSTTSFFITTGWPHHFSLFLFFFYELPAEMEAYLTLFSCQSVTRFK